MNLDSRVELGARRALQAFPSAYLSIRQIVQAYPLLYFALLRLSSQPDRAVTPQTDLVIEGYPRSGNSFVEAGFRVLAGKRRLKLAHHTHALAQVIRATRLKKPTIILFRDPLHSVASLTQFAPSLWRPEEAYQHYHYYYERTLAYKDHYVLCSFQTATSDFQILVRMVETRFGLHFGFDHKDQKFDTEVLNLVEALSQRRVGRSTEYVFQSQDASIVKRSAEKQQLIESLRANEAQSRPASRARETYDRLCRLSDC